MSFDTWRTLVRVQRLSHPQAIDLIERLTRESAPTAISEEHRDAVGGVRKRSD